jgi:hypothetical protein
LWALLPEPQSTLGDAAMLSHIADFGGALHAFSLHASVYYGHLAQWVAHLFDSGSMPYHMLDSGSMPYHTLDSGSMPYHTMDSGSMPYHR